MIDGFVTFDLANRPSVKLHIDSRQVFAIAGVPGNGETEVNGGAWGWVVKGDYDDVVREIEKARR